MVIFLYILNKLVTQVQHAHGLEVDHDGNIYVTYVSLRLYDPITMPLKC